jgi:hypothetical protein
MKRGPRISYPTFRGDNTALPRLTDDELLDAELSRYYSQQSLRNGFDIPAKGPCDCAECLTGKGKRRASMPVDHNCSYSAARSALVGKAVLLTEKVIGKHARARRFDATFTMAMDALVKQFGLLNGTHDSNGNGAGANGEATGTSNGATGGQSSSKPPGEASGAILAAFCKGQ